MKEQSINLKTKLKIIKSKIRKSYLGHKTLCGCLQELEFRLWFPWTFRLNLWDIFCTRILNWLYQSLSFRSSKLNISEALKINRKSILILQYQKLEIWQTDSHWQIWCHLRAFTGLSVWNSGSSSNRRRLIDQP